MRTWIYKQRHKDTNTYLREIIFCVLIASKWEQARRDDRVRGVRLQTGFASQIDITRMYPSSSEIISRFHRLLLLGLCLGAFLAGVTCAVLLDAEIRVDGITYIYIACVEVVLSFIIFPRRILREIITIIEWKQRQ